MEKYLGINLMRNACDLYKNNPTIQFTGTFQYGLVTNLILENLISDIIYYITIFK